MIVKPEGKGRWADTRGLDVLRSGYVKSTTHRPQNPSVFVFLGELTEFYWQHMPRAGHGRRIGV